MSFICDGKWIKDQILEIGNDVIVKAVAIASQNKWGDATETISQTTIKAIVCVYSRTDSDDEHAIFSGGELILATHADNASVIVSGNRVVFNSDEFEINRVVQHRVANVLYLIEASLRKV